MFFPESRQGSFLSTIPRTCTSTTVCSMWWCRQCPACTAPPFCSVRPRRSTTREYDQGRRDGTKTGSKLPSEALATKPRLEGGFLTASRDSYSAIYSTKCPTAVVQTFNLLPLPANCRWSIFRNYRSSIPIPNVTEPKEASKEP